MALRGALVDRARIYARQPVAARRVEGTTRMVDSAGPWIRARLELPQSPESEAPPTWGRRRAVTVPTLMLLVTDTEGGVVNLTTEHRLGVVSKNLYGGVETIFEVTADPAPIRKKRRVIGWTCQLRRVADHAPAPLAGVN